MYNGEQIINRDAIDEFFLAACEQYEKTAPMVHTYLDALYMRLSDNLKGVSALELMTVTRLWENGIWEHPNYAQNRIYKLMAELDMEERGILSF